MPRQGTESVDLTADQIDVRDIIARVETLREERSPLADEVADAGQERADAETEGMEAGFAAADQAVTDAEAALAEWDDSEDGEELKTLEAILEDLAGNGGDEQWGGVWYPVTLIRDSYFEAAMDELIEDIGDMPKDIPAYLTVTVDYDALRQDYTSTEIDGETYWYR